MRDPDSLEDVGFEEGVLRVAVEVAEWLLLEGCSRRTAVRRLHAAGGSKAEARSMVRLVHLILKSAVGRAYKRLPDERRIAYFTEIERFIRESIQFDSDPDSG